MKNQLTLVFFSLLILFSCKKETNNDPAPFDTSFVEKTFGGNEEDRANSIITSNQALYIFGTSASFGDINGDHYLIKTTLNGTVVYEKNYGGTGFEEGIDIIETNDGNLMLIGTTTSLGNGLKDIHVIKIDTNGTMIWENTFGGALDDYPADIIETSTGEFCIAGTTESFGAGSRDIYLVWIDQNGNFLRQATHGGTDIDGSAELIETTNQNIMLYGYTRNYGAQDRDLYLLKTNNLGDSLWSQRYGGSGYEESQSFKVNQNGEYILCGHSSSVDPLHNLYGVKVDTSGTVIWEKHYGGVMHDGGEALLVDSDNNIIFIARTMSFGAGQRDTYFVKTNQSGNMISSKVYGGSGNDKVNEIIEIGNCYYLVGESDSFGNGSNDVYLIIQHK
jgi:hypothetical protein